MLSLEPRFGDPAEGSGGAPRILCLGAHPDDIEIGCGGTLLELLARHPGAHVDWVVFGAAGGRRAEAADAAGRFLARAGGRKLMLHDFRDGFFPEHWSRIKERFEEVRSQVSPQLVFTHYRHDLHQDHRVISELTWNTFRDHLVLEYEIPKWDGDLGVPNVYAPLSREACDAKIAALLECFPSQRGKDWFEEETFRALLRLRGMEARSPSGYAEAFHARKAWLFAPGSQG